MSIPILTKVKVISKFTNDGTDRNGNPRIYYNLKVADPVTYDNQIVGVPEEVYNSVTEGQDVSLVGKAGGLKEKYWYINGIMQAPKR